MKTSERGFSFIEIILVVAILGFLIGLTLLSVGTIRERARITNLLAFSSSAHRLLGADCAGQWELEEGSGSQISDRCRNNVGFANGATWTSGIGDGYALEFDGLKRSAVSYHVVPYDPEVGFTIDAFVYPYTTTSHDVLFSTPLPYVSRNGSRFHFAWRDKDFNIQNIESGNVIAPNRWHHVLSTHSGDTATLYVDGIEAATVSNTSLAAPDSDTRYIGYLRGSTDHHFNGVLDSIRMYNASLPLQ